MFLSIEMIQVLSESLSFYLRVCEIKLENNK